MIVLQNPAGVFKNLFSSITVSGVCLLICVLSSCSYENHDEQTANHPVVSHKALHATKKSLLEQKWLDAKDSSHSVTMNNGYWYDLYNNDTVSVNPYMLYTDFPDKGGQISENGTILHLEESPGNFYDFRITQIDSQHLFLRLVAADLEYSFIKITELVSAEK